MKFTICGSLKFEPLWHEWNKRLGLMGHISYSVMTFPSIEGSKSWYTPEQKWTLDLAHLAKIEESDAILLLNKDRYIGESTGRELEWAYMRNKLVFWLEAYPPKLKHSNDRSIYHLPGWQEYVARYGVPK